VHNNCTYLWGTESHFSTQIRCVLSMQESEHTCHFGHISLLCAETFYFSWVWWCIPVVPGLRGGGRRITSSRLAWACLKKTRTSQVLVVTPVIPATQEGEIRRIMVQSQPWANSSRDPISKNSSNKNSWSGSRWSPWVQTPAPQKTNKQIKDWGYIFVVQCMLSLQRAPSSNPITAKNLKVNLFY
jgi:hypothetical protein